MRIDKSFVLLLIPLGGCATTAAGEWAPRVNSELSAPVETVSSPAVRAVRPAPVSEEMHRNEIAFAFGEIYEAEETGLRVGFDYERRAPDGWGSFLNEKWGIGAMVDFDRRPVESFLVAAQFVYHPAESVGLVLAPGFIFDDDSDEDTWVMRLGSRYSFHITKHFSLTPEIFYDIMEGGRRKGVLAIAIGYGF